MTEVGNKKENFKSYLNECLESAEDHIDYSPTFLQGELEVARANNVCLYVAQKIKAQSKKKKNAPSKKRIGLLIITNFRLCFVAFDEREDKSYTLKKSVSHQENNYLEKYDITLSNMDEIYAYTDKKHKLVAPQQKNPSKIDAIRILCKNFRMLTFDFTENCEVGKGKNIADALLQFAFPTRHNLLFMYHFKEKYYDSSRCFRTYGDENDWNHELERCGISSQHGAWRVLERKSPGSSDALPRCFVIPRHLTDEKYLDLCKSFRCNRAAVWVWSTGSASLLRMADLTPELLNNPKETSTNKKIENLMLEHIRMCADIKSAAPKCIELTKGLPSIQDVYQSYVRLRTLCAPISDRELMTQDEKFLTQLEKTCWLLYVSLCLKTANEAAKCLQEGESVVLQENEGRDMNCVISSIIQVLLDPFYRTINGFQMLIQKEWVALGHPFCDRIGHVYNKQSERSPLFLLFLDCVWQVLQQFPGSFEYSETFLTTIWDMVFLPIFDTFQFNSEADRLSAVHEDNLVLRPVWDWGEVFNEKDIALFSNPLYKKPQLTEQEIENNRRSRLPPSALKLPGFDALPKNHPKQRFSLQPARKIDTDTKLLRPSEIFNHTTLDVPKKLTVSEKPANSNNENKHLKPSHSIWDLEIFSQCYYRFMPLLEIRNGGYIVQIDLFNRMLLNNMHRMQRAIETGNFSDLQLDDKDKEQSSNITSSSSDNEDILLSESGTHRDSTSGGSGSAKQKVPVVNSFFPFSYTDSSDVDISNLNEILLFNSMSEGSVLDFEM